MNSISACLALIVTASFALMPKCATNDPITATNAAKTCASQPSWVALASLHSQNPGVRALCCRAKAILVFPSITRAGFVIGGQAGIHSFG